MGLKKITRIRQYTDFDPNGKVVKMYEVTFTTEKTAGEFTLDVPAVDYSAEMAKDMAAEQAIEIDKAVG